MILLLSNTVLGTGVNLIVKELALKAFDVIVSTVILFL